MPSSRGVLVGERPADVVVAAHVVDPRGAGRAVRGAARAPAAAAAASRVASASHVSAICSGLYESWHSSSEMYSITSSGCTIASDLNSSDGRRHPQHRVERLQQQVGLGQRLARRAQPLPDERDGIHPQDLDALVRQEQHLAGHRPEHRGVRVVQVPLEVVERRPDPRARPGSCTNEPGWSSGKISRTVRSYASGIVRSGKIR